MTDVFPRDKRSWIMSRVHGKNTSLELTVRSLTHKLGYRYRIHREDLPGKPDLVFPSRSKVIFVHGCFWHGHSCSRGNRIPKTNEDYWRKKIMSNINRSEKHILLLKDLGWDSLIIWECKTKDMEALESILVSFLEHGTT